MPDCFVVRWLCGGAWAWLPGDWQVGLLTAVYHQAMGQQRGGALMWELVLAKTGAVVSGGRN